MDRALPDANRPRNIRRATAKRKHFGHNPPPKALALIFKRCAKPLVLRHNTRIFAPLHSKSLKRTFKAKILRLGRGAIPHPAQPRGHLARPRNLRPLKRIHRFHRGRLRKNENKNTDYRNGDNRKSSCYFRFHLSESSYLRIRRKPLLILHAYCEQGNQARS